MKKEYYIFKIKLKALNILANVSFIVLFGIIYLIFPNIIIKFFEYFDNVKFCILFLPITMLYMALHEVLHALGYLLYGANFKKITFGMELEKGVFYCLCKEDISRKNILNSVLFPLFYIGVLTLTIGIVFKLPLLVVLSLLNISGASADIMYFMFIVKLDKSIKFSELDDGTSFAILSDKDVSKVKHIGLEYVEKRSNIERNDLKKIKVSKLSYIVLILCLLLTIYCIL